MIRFARLIKDRKGATMVEFALMVPALVTFLFGFFHIGVVLWADAGLKSAVGEASRKATLFPTPTDAQIKTQFNNGVFRMAAGSVGTPVVTRGTVGTQKYVDIAVTYNHTIDLIFFPLIPVQLSETRRAYIQAE